MVWGSGVSAVYGNFLLYCAHQNIQASEKYYENQKKKPFPGKCQHENGNSDSAGNNRKALHFISLGDKLLMPVVLTRHWKQSEHHEKTKKIQKEDLELLSNLNGKHTPVSTCFNQAAGT